MVSVLLSEIGKCGFFDAEYWGERGRGVLEGDFDIDFVIFLGIEFSNF